MTSRLQVDEIAERSDADKSEAAVASVRCRAAGNVATIASGANCAIVSKRKVR